MRAYALRACAVAALLTVAAMASDANAQHGEYYKGKTLRFMIGAPAGGGYDVYGRLFVDYFKRHLPGQPTIIVQNMPGGGALIVGNYIYGQAAPDGLTLGLAGGSLATAGLFGLQGARFDSRKFAWVGSISAETGVTVAWAATSPVKTTDELFTKELIVGAAGSAAASAVFPAALNKILNTRFKIIAGYGGAPDIALAMERGEVQGMGNWNFSSIQSNRQEWLREKTILLLLQLGLERRPDLADVPTIIDVAKSEDQKTLLRLVFAQQVLGRPIIGAPGTPDEITTMLQKAFDATMTDPDLIAEARRRKIDIASPTSGPEAAKFVDQLYGYDPKFVTAAGEAMIVSRK